MADEAQDQAAPVVEPVDQLDDDFDWGKFFAGDGVEDDVATPPVGAAPVIDEDEDDLRTQLKQAQETSAKALEMATQAQTQAKMQNAVEAWKAQATPAEIELQALLLDSKTPEELQKNAQIVKVAAARLDAAGAERDAKLRREMERQMQQEFGLPIPPTFQPMPEKEKIAQLLKDGELADAAATMMKGF